MLGSIRLNWYPDRPAYTDCYRSLVLPLPETIGLKSQLSGVFADTTNANIDTSSDFLGSHCDQIYLNSLHVFSSPKDLAVSKHAYKLI